jgi:hypothetical protein
MAFPAGRVAVNIADGGGLDFSWADWSLVALASLQAAWLLGLLGWAAASKQLAAGAGPFARIRKAWILRAPDKARIFGHADDGTALHQEEVTVFLRQRSDALIVGALGLAAWSALTAVTTSPVGTQTLRLLLIGVAFNLVGPSLFRTGPTEGSYVGLQAFLIIGYSAIALAVISACGEVFSEGWLNVIAELAGPVVVVIELLQNHHEFQRIRQFLGKPEAPVCEP